VTNQVSPEDQFKRAWDYLSGADEMLHSRLNALLLCEAFLVVGYVELIVTGGFEGSAGLKVAAAAVIVLALLLTLILRAAGLKLQRGGDALKKAFLEKDDVYLTYINAVRSKPSRLWGSSFSRAIPDVFIGFWVLAACHLFFFGMIPGGQP
jgi:hypothetical protein